MIRNECFTSAKSWLPPNPGELEELLKFLKPKYKKEKIIAELLGIESRTLRRWKSGEVRIPYSAWCLLCYEANLGKIWINEVIPNLSTVFVDNSPLNLKE